MPAGGEPSGDGPAGDVAGTVLLTSGGVTRLVNRLEPRGLVARVACPDDKRGTSIAITDTGRDTYQQARPAYPSGKAGDAVLRRLS